MSNQNFYDLTMIFSGLCLLFAFFFLFKSNEFKELKNEFSVFKENESVDVLDSQKIFNNVKLGKNTFGFANLDYSMVTNFTKLNVVMLEKEDDQNLEFNVSNTTRAKKRIRLTNQNQFNDVDWVPA